MNFFDHHNVALFLRPFMSTSQEEIWVLAFDTQLQLLGKEMLFRGTVDRCTFHPRDLFRFLFQQNSMQFILAHNHLSSNCQPSTEDLITTKKITAMAMLFEVNLLDHLIITKDSHFSFEASGSLQRIKNNKNFIRQFRIINKGTG